MPLASVYAEVDDLAGMEHFAAQARDFGFDGVACLHPRQIRAAHAGFRPAPAVIEQERKRVADFGAALAKIREQLQRLG